MLGKKTGAAMKQVADQLEFSITAELRRMGDRMERRDRLIEERLMEVKLSLGDAATAEQVQQALEIAHREVETHLQAAESAAQKANAAAARAHRGLQKHVEEAEEAEELVGQSSNIEDGQYPHARHPKLG